MLRYSANHQIYICQKNPNFPANLMFDFCFGHYLNERHLSFAFVSGAITKEKAGMMYFTIGPKTISKQPSLNSFNTLLKRADDGRCRIPLKYILNKPDVFTVDN